MFYIFVIVTANIIIIGLNTLFSEGLWSNALASVIATAAVIAYDGVTAFLIRRLPEKWFAPESKLSNVSRKEKKLYRKLGVKHLVKLVPELGMFTGFHKDKLRSQTDGEYLGRFILESNYGVVIHLVNALGGGVIGLLPFCGGVSVWLPVAGVNFVLSMLPVFLLRNNTPPLLFLYKKSVKIT